jgi:hypothetical protein
VPVRPGTRDPADDPRGSGREGADLGRQHALVHHPARRPARPAERSPAEHRRETALAWNRLGARINTVSPGVVATAMARSEAESASGGHMMAMLDACGAGRTGTPAEVAEVVAFLTGPSSLYITGTDILIDGGQAAWLRRHRG